MTRRRRNSIIIGVAWVVLALGYFLLAPVLGYQPEEQWAGATMLFALGAAMGIMAYVLTAGSSD
ncbi:MAG TPA: hypothetical protein VJ506_12175 [Candidatus Limnocylindrales bacterium]|nr:hypothetical protein [Candidatus Limnocylindrales bacterium]